MRRACAFEGSQTPLQPCSEMREGREGIPTWYSPWLCIQHLPATAIVLGRAALFATLFRGRFVVA